MLGPSIVYVGAVLSTINVDDVISSFLFSASSVNVSSFALTARVPSPFSTFTLTIILLSPLMLVLIISPVAFEVLINSRFEESKFSPRKQLPRKQAHSGL